MSLLKRSTTMYKTCYQPQCMPFKHQSLHNSHATKLAYSPHKRIPFTPNTTRTIRTNAIDIVDGSSITAIEHAQVIYDMAGLNSATAALISSILRPALSLSSLLMIVRIVLTWYPEIDATKMPWSIAYTPTEPLLDATRKVVKPFNGLDVSPIVWVAILSFLSEILTGPQGILSLIERKGI